MLKNWQWNAFLQFKIHGSQEIAQFTESRRKEHTRTILIFILFPCGDLLNFELNMTLNFYSVM